MTAKLRHSLPRPGVVQLTVTPNDGRFPEKFTTCEAEARRFAWSILADLDPVAAAAAAEEEGSTLGDLTAPVPIPRVSRLGPIDRSGRPGVAGQIGPKAARVLRTLEEGSRLSSDIRRLCPNVADVSAVLCNLRTAGFAARMDAGGQGTPATWGATTAGLQWIKDNGKAG